MVGTEPCVRTIDKGLAFQHMGKFLFQRHRRCLFTLIPGHEAHGKRDTVRIHEKAHLNDRVGTVLFRHAVFPKTADNFSGHLINIIKIGRFDLEVKVGAVVIADRGIPFHYIGAVLVKVADIFLVVFFHKIHRAEDMDIIKVGLFVIIR